MPTSESAAVSKHAHTRLGGTAASSAVKKNTSVETHG